MFNNYFAKKAAKKKAKWIAKKESQIVLTAVATGSDTRPCSKINEKNQKSFLA
jgi:hypothetical protein